MFSITCTLSNKGTSDLFLLKIQLNFQDNFILWFTGENSGLRGLFFALKSYPDPCCYCNHTKTTGSWGETSTMAIWGSHESHENFLHANKIWFKVQWDQDWFDHNVKDCLIGKAAKWIPVYLEDPGSNPTLIRYFFATQYVTISCFVKKGGENIQLQLISSK